MAPWLAIELWLKRKRRLGGLASQPWHFLAKPSSVHKSTTKSPAAVMGAGLKFVTF